MRYAGGVPAPTPQYVRDLSVTNEFAALSDGVIQNVIDRVVLLYKQLTPEDLYTPVVGLHTAHLLKVQLMLAGGGNNNVGQLLRAKLGPAEKQFGQDQKQVQPGAGLDDTTAYGRECERLLRSRLPAMRVSGGV